MGLFLKFISVSMRSQMQYPASFIMLCVSYFLGTFIDIIGLWVLFDRFQMVQGWTLYEVGLIYGIIHMGFGIAEAFAKVFDNFYLLIKNGDFDRLLLRPLSPLFQTAARDVQLMRLGRSIQGFAILLISAKELSLSLISPHAFIILLSIIGTFCLFYGLFVIQAAISFWTVETLEIMNITTYGGLQMGQYPITIYTKPFRLFFTFLVPIACVAYYPIATWLRHETVPLFLGMIAPLAGILFLIIACKFWSYGVKHYTSTGS